MNQLFKAFGDMKAFLENPELTSSACAKMLAIFNDPPQLRKFQIELAIMVDAMEPFVKPTYILEGDGVLALNAYGHLDALYQNISLEHYPNVSAIAKRLSAGNSVHEQQLILYTKECVKPAYEDFKQKFSNDLQHVVKAFKAAQLFSPSRVSNFNQQLLTSMDFVRFHFWTLLQWIVYNLNCRTTWLQQVA